VLKNLLPSSSTITKGIQLDLFATTVLRVRIAAGIAHLEIVHFTAAADTYPYQLVFSDIALHVKLCQETKMAAQIARITI
jgi:hypothetical protein